MACLSLLCGFSALAAQEIWLSPTGSGDGKDANNPIYAGDQVAYDSILNKHQANWTFWYLPGTYQTKGGGTTRYTVWPGQKHLAMQTNKPTVIRLVDSGAGYGSIFFNQRGIDNFEVRDLTFDCNAPGNPMFTQGLGQVSAINLNGGNNIRLSGLTIKGFGTAKVGTECFPLACVARPRRNSAQAETYTNIAVENCVFTAAAPGNRDGVTCGLVISIKDLVPFPLSPAPKLVNAYIRDCTVTNIDTPHTKFNYTHGLTAPLVEHCYFDGVHNPIYFEPNPVLDAYVGTFTIRANTFLNYARGIAVAFLANGRLGELIIDGNLFLPGVDSRSTVLSVLNPEASLGDAIINRVVVTNNTIRYADSKSRRDADNVGFNFSRAGSVEMHNNIINLGKGKEILIRSPRSVRSVTLVNNTTSSGNLLSVRDQSLNEVANQQRGPRGVRNQPVDPRTKRSAPSISK